MLNIWLGALIPQLQQIRGVEDLVWDPWLGRLISQFPQVLSLEDSVWDLWFGIVGLESESRNCGQSKVFESLVWTLCFATFGLGSRLDNQEPARPARILGHLAGSSGTLPGLLGFFASSPRMACRYQTRFEDGALD